MFSTFVKKFRTFKKTIYLYITILRSRAEVARKAHNLEVSGSIPFSATNKKVLTIQKEKKMITTTTYTGKQYPQGKQTPTGLAMSYSILS